MLNRLLSQLFPTTNKSKYGYSLPDKSIVDPLRCYRNLLGGRVNQLLDDRDSDNVDNYEKAEVALLALIRKTFGLPDMDKKGRGYSDQDCLDILDDFFGYIEKKGEKAKNSVTLPQPIQSTQAESLKNNDCGCI